MKVIYGIIYIIVNLINWNIYIGQTTQFIEHRWLQHKKSKTYIGNAIRKYGEDNFYKEQIDIAYSREELNEKETYYIGFLNSYIKEVGYNLTLGGEGGIFNEEVRQKQKERMTKIWASPKVRQKQSEIQTKTWSSPEIRQKHSEIQTKAWSSPEIRQKQKEKMTEVWASPELRQKQKEKMTEVWASPEMRQKQRESHLERSIICIETKEIFDAGIDIVRKYGYDARHISQCCHGKRRTANGFHWAFYNKYQDYLSPLVLFASANTRASSVKL